MFLQKLKEVRCFVLDVDGVLTDGGILVTEEGQQLRTMNIKDGYALNRATTAGYEVIVISGGNSEGVRLRLNKLGVSNVHMGVEDKSKILIEQLQVRGLDLTHCLVMGDDLPDMKIMQMAGCSACPSDAVSEIRQLSDYRSSYSGGNGCVRDVIEKTMRLSGKW